MRNPATSRRRVRAHMKARDDRRLSEGWVLGRDESVWVGATELMPGGYFRRRGEAGWFKMNTWRTSPHPDFVTEVDSWGPYTATQVAVGEDTHGSFHTCRLADITRVKEFS